MKITKVEGGQVRAAVLAMGVGHIAVRTCCLCRTWLNYIIRDGEIFFDSNCDCVNYTIDPEPRTWESVANLINMQTDAGVNKEYRQKFGLLTEWCCEKGEAANIEVCPECAEISAGYSKAMRDDDE